jgi:cholesterol transport system auxiliary component
MITFKFTARHLVPLILLAGLSGCGPLVNLSSDKGAMTLYSLAPMEKAEGIQPPLPDILLVEQPQAPGSLDSARIALKPSPLEVQYFGKVKWADRAPKMLQNMLVTSFENAGVMKAVGAETMGMPADYRLKINLRDMQANYPSPDAIPTIEVTLSLKLVSKSPLMLVDQIVISKSVRARQNKLPDIMKAFDEATGEVLKDTVAWTAAAVAKKDELPHKEAPEKKQEAPQ